MIELDNIMKKQARNLAVAAKNKIKQQRTSAPATLDENDFHALPFTEEDAREVAKSIGLDYDLPWQYQIKDVVGQMILPALDDLKFMGVDPLPDLAVVGRGLPDRPDIVPICYEPDMSDADRLDMAMQNAGEGEIACTIGRVNVPMFATMFAFTLRAVRESTTAHRRYRVWQITHKIRLIVHTDYDHVEMFVREDLLMALNIGTRMYLAGT